MKKSGRSSSEEGDRTHWSKKTLSEDRKRQRRHENISASSRSEDLCASEDEGNADIGFFKSLITDIIQKELTERLKSELEPAAITLDNEIRDLQREAEEITVKLEAEETAINEEELRLTSAMEEVKDYVSQTLKRMKDTSS